MSLEARHAWRRHRRETTGGMPTSKILRAIGSACMRSTPPTAGEPSALINNRLLWLVGIPPNMPSSILVINKMSVFVLLIILTRDVSIKCYDPS